MLVSGALGLLIFHFQERDTFQCETCLAERHVLQWRIGFWRTASLPLAPKQTTIRYEQFGRDMLAADHSHEWHFAQGSPYAWFGRTWFGCALGRYRQSHWVKIYAEEPMFRQIIKRAIEAGKFSKQELIEGATGSSNASKESERRLEALFDLFLDQRG